jgi:hypothetical protein
MDDWLTAARDAIADVADVDPASLALSEAETAAILELARIAAHESGARTNAPLLCFLVGRAATGGVSLDAIADAVERSSS